jgi:hypothetical protein
MGKARAGEDELGLTTTAGRPESALDELERGKDDRPGSHGHEPGELVDDALARSRREKHHTVPASENLNTRFELSFPERLLREEVPE